MSNNIQDKTTIRFWITVYTGNFIKKDPVKEALEYARTDNNKKR